MNHTVESTTTKHCIGEEVIPGKYVSRNVCVLVPQILLSLGGSRVSSIIRVNSITFVSLLPSRIDSILQHLTTVGKVLFWSVSCVSMQVLIFALLVAGTLCNALSECPEPDYIWQSNGRCCGVVSCVEDEEVTPCDSDYSSDTCTHCPPGSSMPDKTNSRTIINCIIKKCAEGHTRLIAYSADTKDPNACPIYCECDITYEYCGTDPCDCTKKSCRFGTLLKQNCGCEPDSKSIQTTEVPEPGVTNQASSTISLLNGTGSSTEPTSNATVGTSEESSYNMLPVYIGVSAAVVVIGIVILVSYCIWKRQNTELSEVGLAWTYCQAWAYCQAWTCCMDTGEEKGTVEEPQELDSTDPHQETGGVTERLMDGGGDSPRGNGVGPVRLTERLVDSGGDSPAGAIGMGPVNARRVTYITNNYNINRTESVQFGNDTHSTVTVKHAQDTGPCNHGTGNAMIEDTDVKRMTCDETEQHTDHTGLDMGSESQSPHIKKQHGTSSSNFKGFLGHPS